MRSDKEKVRARGNTKTQLAATDVAVPTATDDVAVVVVSAVSA